MNQKEFDEGYQAAIDQWRQHQQQNGKSGNSDSGGSGSSNGNSGGDGNERDAQDSSGVKPGETLGEVRPEDCGGVGFGDDQPDSVGTFGSRSEGKKTAEAEGYDDTAGGDSAVEKDWKDTSIKASSKLKGDKAGTLKSKIDGLWKTSTDWKKKLKDIIGRSLNPEETRWAFANKNILVSQDRIARTDKDKYNSMDYMIIAIDSSGSMSDEQLKLAISECYQLALQKKPIKLFVIQCDTQIQEIQEFNAVHDIFKYLKHCTVKGRGGTELKPVWDLLKNDKRFKGKPADLFIVWTDGYLNQYKRNPKTASHMLWCILNNPSFKADYVEQATKVLYFNSKDIK